MLTVLETLIVLVNILVLVWALLPVKRVPRFLDFMPLTAVIFLMLHLFLDSEPMRIPFIPLYIFTVTMFLMTIVRMFRHNSAQPKRRVFAAVGRSFALLVLAICILIPTLVVPFNSLPEPSGGFNVGTVVCDFTDKARAETYSEEVGTSRKIAVQFWYPSDKTGSKLQYDISDAPVSTSQQSYPVLIFSHGAFGVRMSNASTFRELASHGYIVASIDHTYQAFYTAFADGKRITASTKFLSDAQRVQTDSLTAVENFGITQEWLDLRTADIELVIDSLQSGELKTEGALLKGRMDLTNIGLFGHSLGGAAAAQVARERNDVTAAIVLDGTMIGDVTGVSSDNIEIITDEPFTKPLMLMYGSLFLESEAKATGYLTNIKAFNQATDEVYSLCIKDSRHLNFTDLPRISPLLSGMLGVGEIDSFECIKLVNAYCMAFFDKHIKGQPSSLLDSSVVDNRVEFDKRNPIGVES